MSNFNLTRIWDSLKTPVILHTHTHRDPNVIGIYFSHFKFRCIATKQAKDDSMGMQWDAFLGAAETLGLLVPWPDVGSWSDGDRPLSGCHEGYTRVYQAYFADSSRAQAETLPSNPPR